MTRDSLNSYYRDIPESRLCQSLGCTIRSVGSTKVGQHASYPVRIHPSHRPFSFDRGRTLEAFQIVFISEGKGQVELGRGTGLQKITSGQVFLLFPNVWHRYAPDPITGWTEHWVECNGSAINMALQAGLISQSRPIYRTSESKLIEDTFAEINNLANEDVVGYQAVLSMLCLKLLAILTALRNDELLSPDRLINNARMLISERCTENCRMHEIAEELNVSYSNLRQRFKVHTGMSMKDYQLTARIQIAKELLSNTNLSVKAVSAELGFRSAFHFSSQFNKHVGISPSKWRSV